MRKESLLRRGKIRTKLVLRLVFVALIPLIFLVVFSWQNTYRTRINSISELETTTILQAESTIKKWINEKFLSFRVVIVDPEMNSFKEISEEKQNCDVLNIEQRWPQLSCYKVKVNTESYNQQLRKE